jgi:hypothetical protein
MINKKQYEAPVVKKVRLEIKNAVLGVCNTSYDSTPRADGLAGVCYLPVGAGGTGCVN